MKFSTISKYAMSLPAVTEEPHHHFSSFRVRGKIFVTVPPGQEYIHVFLSELHREQALAMHPDFVEPLRWGGKVAGIRVEVKKAQATIAKLLVKQAWDNKAPASLRSPKSK